MLRNTQQVMLRIHFLQQWFGLSDVAMEEALFDVPLYRQFAGLGGMNRLPDRVSILRFRHLQVVDRYRSPPRKPALPGGGRVELRCPGIGSVVAEPRAPRQIRILVRPLHLGEQHRHHPIGSRYGNHGTVFLE